MKRNKAIARALQPRDTVAELRAAAAVVFAITSLIFVAFRVLITFR